MAAAYSIRRGLVDDADAMADIYNQAIYERTATFDSFEVYPQRYVPLLDGSRDNSGAVVATDGTKVVGWASVTPISDRWAYRFTGLGSFFVHRDHRRRGVGTILKAAQVAEAVRLGYHSLVVEVLRTNPRSVAINLSQGFKVIGEIAEAGYRDGQWIGLVVMQKLLRGEHAVQRRFRVSIGTDDLARSRELYRDALGLSMPPQSTPVLTFPLDEHAELQVCLRDAAGDLLDSDLELQPARGIVMSLFFESDAKLAAAADAALRAGCVLVGRGDLPSWQLEDFNGVIWHLRLH